jgi:Domain of unknown function (DUF4157)
MSEHESLETHATEPGAPEAESEPRPKRHGERTKPRIPGVAPGKSRVQMRSAGPARGDVHAAAARGIASPTTRLPFADQIQASFGDAHDVSRIQAHVGGDSAAAMGANAYASGDHVVFDREPDLHTAAHEAAHVIQQAHGVNLYGGVGEAGDGYERHADEVADRVVAGKSAADLLGAPTNTAGPGTAVQMDNKTVPNAELEARLRPYMIGATRAALENETRVLIGRTKTLISIMKREPDTRGYGGKVREVQDEYVAVAATIARLDSMLSHSSMDPRDIAAIVRRFNYAFDGFHKQLGEMVAYLSSRGYSLPQQMTPETLRLSVVSLNKNINLNSEYSNGNASDPVVVKPKDPSDDDMRANAIEESMEAVVELAKAIPVASAERRGDYIEWLRGHVAELADSLSSPRTGAKPPGPINKAALREVLGQMHELEKKIATDAKLTLALHRDDWSKWIASIRKTGLK